MWNDRLLTAIVVMSACNLLVILLSGRYPVIVDLFVVCVSGLLAGAALTWAGDPILVGHFDLDWPIFKLAGYRSLSLLYLEVGVSIVLFVVCLLRAPALLLQERQMAYPARILWSAPFSVSYAAIYTLLTAYKGQLVVATIIGVAAAGIAGAVASPLLPPLPRLPVAALRRYARPAGRLLLALAMLAVAILLPLREPPQGALAYGVQYQSKSGPVTKWQAKIDTYLGLANYYHKIGDLDTSIALLGQSILADPQSRAGYLQRADLLMQRGQYRAAIADLDVAVSLSPTDTNVYYGRALAYEALGDYDQAIANLDQAIAYKPDDTLAYQARAGLSIYSGEYSQALADNNKLKRLEPALTSSPVVTLVQGIAYLGQGEGQKSQQVLASLKRLGYAYAITIVNTGVSKAASVMVSFKLSIPVINTTIYTRSLAFFASASPTDFARTLSERFNSAQSTLDYVAPAMNNLAQSSSAPEAMAVYRSLGGLYALENRHEMAIDYYQKVADLASGVDAASQRDALKGIGDSAAALGQTDVARQAYRQFIAVDPRQPMPLSDLAEIYYKLGLLNLKDGQLEDAIQDLSEALKLSPDYADALTARAEAYFKTGKPAQAAADALRAAQLEPDSIETRLALGRYLSSAGEYTQSLEILLPIESRAGNNPLYYHSIGCAYVAGGDRPAALAAYDKAFRLTAELGSYSYTRKSDAYEQMVDDLRRLAEQSPAASQITDDIWIMMRGAMSADNVSLSSAGLDSYKVNSPAIASVESSSALLSYARAADVTLTTTSTVPVTSVTATTAPATQTLWVQQAVVGPERIYPGSSGTVEVVAELRRYADSDGTAFPVELYKDHNYSIEIRPNIINFEVGGETDPARLTRPLKMGQPVRWQWLLSPQSGREGNQTVVYTIVVRDSDESGWFREIPTNSILVSVPNRYSIPPYLLYPFSGVIAAIGAIITLPVWQAFYTAWKKRSRRLIFRALGITTEEETPEQKLLIELHDILARHFDEGELRTLCLNLGLDYNDLPDTGKANKARELVTYCDRHGRISELADRLKQLRPHVFE